MSGRLGASGGDSPYKLMAGPYLSLGWSPIPLKYRTKFPVPEKYTGADGKWVTEADVKGWLKPRAMVSIGNLVYPPGNIALRMPKHIIGLDVDAYEGKAGAETLGAAEAEYGKLPPTWVSSSRLGSPLSGIRYFRVPEGLSWPGDLRSRFGGGVELIRWDHRYAIVGPSVHEDTGEEYFWRAPDGTVVMVNLAALQATLDGATEGGDGAELDIPATDADVAWGAGGIDPDGVMCDIPDLPESWVKGLTGGASWTGGHAMAGEDGGELSPEEVKAWLDERKAAGNPNACHVMQATTALWLRRIRTAGDDGGAHEATRDGVWAVLGDSAAGHSGLKRSLDSLWQAFREAVKTRRGPGKAGARVAGAEWKRIVSRGVSKIAAEGPPYEGGDLCAGFGGGGREPAEESAQAAAAEREAMGVAGGGGSSPFDFKMDDGGNAQRLKRLLGDDVLWCGPLGGWYFWHEREGVWRLDPEGLRMNREALGMVRSMELEAIEIADLKVRMPFLKWVKASGKLGAIRAASDLMKSLQGVSVAPSEFDSAINLINCENGVVELGPISGVALSGSGEAGEAVTFRPAQPGDRFTISTGVRYIEGAQQACGDWKDFLERFLPDPEMRAWAQKVAAYSLWGRNSARVIVLLKGATSTGKTTFAEAIRGALGKYAGPFGLSLLRDNQDERPRPDIVEAMSRRLIIAEETSAAWKLHADQIKRATGDGIWRGRPMFGKVSIERVPAFVPWILTNNLPTIEGSDPALEKRIRMILFLHPVSLAEDDIGFKVRLEQEPAREAVLEWLVEGWRLYREDPGLNDMPALVAEATLNAMNELSEFDEMLSDVAQKEAGEYCRTSDLYAAYLLWMGENGHERDILSANKFGRRLTEKGYPIEQAWDSERQRASRIRRGISLRENWQNIAVTGQ